MNKILKFINTFVIMSIIATSMPKVSAADSKLNDEKLSVQSNSQELLESKLFEAIANVNPELVSMVLFKMIKANMLSPLIEKSILLEAKNNIVKYSDKSNKLKILNSIVVTGLGLVGLIGGAVFVEREINRSYGRRDDQKLALGIVGLILSSVLLPNGIGFIKSVGKNRANSANALKVFNLIKTRLKQNRSKSKKIQADQENNSKTKAA